MLDTATASAQLRAQRFVVFAQVFDGSCVEADLCLSFACCIGTRGRILAKPLPCRILGWKTGRKMRLEDEASPATHCRLRADLRGTQTSNFEWSATSASYLKTGMSSERARFMCEAVTHDCACFFVSRKELNFANAYKFFCIRGNAQFPKTRDMKSDRNWRGGLEAKELLNFSQLPTLCGDLRSLPAVGFCPLF